MNTEDRKNSEKTWLPDLRMSAEKMSAFIQANLSPPPTLPDSSASSRPESGFSLSDLAGSAR